MSEDTKIYLITYNEKRHNRLSVKVSHGVGNNTLKNYCLPQETLASFNPKRDDSGYYIEA